MGGRWRPARLWDQDPAVAEGAVRRVLVLGDIHNHDGVLHTALTIAERQRCGAVGGTVSPDKSIPKLAPYRWPDHEAPNRNDLRRLAANAPDGLDVLLCHDAPSGVQGLQGLPDSLIPTWIRAECGDVRDSCRTPSIGSHRSWCSTALAPDQPRTHPRKQDRSIRPQPRRPSR